MPSIHEYWKKLRHCGQYLRFSCACLGTPLFWGIASALVLFIWCLYALFLGPHAAQRRTPPIPVSVTQVEVRDVPIYLSTIGTITATDTVLLRTRVSGQLIKTYFDEGQSVVQGQLLAEIDPRPYLWQVKQYEGQLARDRATLENAQRDLMRYAILREKNAISQQVLDTQRSLVKQTEGSVKLDEGLLGTAQVNLEDCKIYAPISGTIGLRQIDPGNYIDTNSNNALAILNRADPITVVFSVPEQHAPRLIQHTGHPEALRVELYNRDQTIQLATGTLSAIDNQIDPNTGTIKLKATFDNRTHALFPNQFVHVKLRIEQLSQARVVPNEALQKVDDTTFVSVMNPQDHTVKSVAIQVIKTLDTQSVIRGVNPGEWVVTETAEKLRDGDLVIARNITTPKTATQRNVEPSRKRASRL